MKPIALPARGMKVARWPVGHIYQGHGENVALYSKSVCTPNCNLPICCLQGHNGIDVAMEEGTPILATAGKVIDIKDTPTGYGKHIRILTEPDENQEFWELTYGHLKEIQTAIGMVVKDGQQIGTMGNTGFIVSGSTPYWGNAPAGKGVHLHLTARPCTSKQTLWFTKYPSGDNFYLKSYDNGVFGSVDPVPYIEEWIRQQIVKTQYSIIELLKKLIETLKGRT